MRCLLICAAITELVLRSNCTPVNQQIDTNMNTKTRPEPACASQPDSKLLTDLIIDAHHGQDGLDRYADAIQTLAREEAHSASGKSFPEWALGEFDLPPTLTEALLRYRPDDESDQGSLA